MSIQRPEAGGPSPSVPDADPPEKETSQGPSLEPNEFTDRSPYIGETPLAPDVAAGGGLMGVTLMNREQEGGFEALMESVQSSANEFVDKLLSKSYTLAGGYQASASVVGVGARGKIQLGIQVNPFDIVSKASVEGFFDFILEAPRVGHSPYASVGYSANPASTGSKCNAQAAAQIANVSVSTDLNGGVKATKKGGSPQVSASIGLVCETTGSMRETIDKAAKTLEATYYDAIRRLGVP